MRLTSIESSFRPCDITAIDPGAYPGEAKMCQTGESGISPILLIYYTAIYIQLKLNKWTEKSRLAISSPDEFLVYFYMGCEWVSE